MRRMWEKDSAFTYWRAWYKRCSAHRVKAYCPDMKNSKKLRPRAAVCKLLNFPDKARTLKNSHRLKGTTYYVKEDFSKEALAYRKELWKR